MKLAFSALAIVACASTQTTYPPKPQRYVPHPITGELYFISTHEVPEPLRHMTTWHTPDGPVRFARSYDMFCVVSDTTTLVVGRQLACDWKYPRR